MSRKLDKRRDYTILFKHSLAFPGEEVIIIISNRQTEVPHLKMYMIIHFVIETENRVSSCEKISNNAGARAEHGVNF